MANGKSDKKERENSKFRLLVICFVLLVISLPAFYFGNGRTAVDQNTILLIIGFVTLVLGMIISILVKAK